MDSDSLLPLSESLELPVIDFSDQNLAPGTSKWDEVKDDVRKALEDYGCFQAYVDKVSNIELNKPVFEAMEELFDLPVQTKQRNVSSKPLHGYLSHNLYQSLGIEEANDAEKVNYFTQQLWPDHGNKSISETMHKFSERSVELDVMARRMIMESFGIEKYLDEHLNSTYYVLRLMKYTSAPDDDVEETKLGLLSHTDKSITTILHQYEVDGLEIKTKDEKWIKVKPSQHCFIIMVGDFLCLPVIDFSDQNLTPGTSKWDKVKADVRKALEDYGCFQAYVDKVSNIELDKSVYEAMEKLFDLPVQTKQRNVSSKPFHGYLSHNLYQSLGIEDANVAEKVNDFIQLLWPDHGNKSISEMMHKFSEQLVELDVMVRRMIMESFGVEKYLDEHLNSTNYLFRMMKYTAPPDEDVEEAKLGLRSHTDKNIITILHQYEVDGLEIMTKDGQWIKVKPSQHSFIIMVGDSLCVSSFKLHTHAHTI
ncbi:unnamed protein product [Brassica napus]|uniref:(rape) hypothetical protein n=1 Tax=Brassica napus TaxID=3708 RepID=A0A816IJC1_BRANA|nr:unnamed protein product [Brassica napus]